MEPHNWGEAPKLPSLRCERSGLKKAGDGDGPGAGPRASRSRCHGGHSCFPGAPSCPAQRHFEHLPCFLLSPPLASPKPSRLVDQTPPRQPPRRLPDKTPNPDSSPKRPAPQLHQAQASARAGRIAAWLLHLKPRRWQARGSPLIPLTLCAASRARSWRAPETFSCTGLCSTLSLFHPPNLYFQQGAGEQSNRARGQLLGGRVGDQASRKLPILLGVLNREVVTKQGHFCTIRTLPAREMGPCYRLVTLSQTNLKQGLDFGIELNPNTNTRFRIIKTFI